MVVIHAFVPPEKKNCDVCMLKLVLNITNYFIEYY